MTGSWLGAVMVSIAGTATAAPRDPEEKLARALQGRVAGEPVDCIYLREVRNKRIIDRTAILYDAGRTIYVNRPRAGQTSLETSDTLVTRNYSDQLCNIDTVQLVDSSSQMFSGVVFLGDFVPYTRPKKAD
ncbi:hypothetical protein ACFB49_33040 [Sphingomonas sp. DBB INV C78]|uniref:hypothetical protein n=1 Tax=Sphingomonas sp. DBB INV C78 TaxID=3349434 RepID=UPI0036D31F05